MLLVHGWMMDPSSPPLLYTIVHSSLCLLHFGCILFQITLVYFGFILFQIQHFYLSLDPLSKST